MENKEKFAFIKRIIDNYDEDDLELLNLFHRALLDLKSEKPHEYITFKSYNKTPKEMEMCIKLCNFAYIKDDNHIFKAIEIRDDGLYVETKNGYFYIDNNGNKVERL